MPFKPPLTLHTLREISARSPKGSDAWVLLWELRRYHALARRAAQYMHSEHSMVNPVARIFIEELNADPAVREWLRSARDGVPLGQPAPPPRFDPPEPRIRSITKIDETDR